jgi:hypothetical protein
MNSLQNGRRHDILLKSGDRQADFHGFLTTCKPTFLQSEKFASFVASLADRLLPSLARRPPTPCR